MSNIVVGSSKKLGTAAFEAKDIRLPDFQRSLVWTNQDKRNLLFSTILRFPIGAICVGKDQIDEGNGRITVQYLLDGQQRLDCISDMMIPELIANWVNIPKPKFPDDKKFSTDDEWKNYNEIKFMEQVYDYLGLAFEESEDYIAMIEDPDYITLQNEYDLLNRQKPRPVAEINSKKHEINFFEFDALKGYVEKLNDKTQGEKLPFFSDFVLIPTIIQVIEAKRRNLVDFFLCQKDLITPLKQNEKYSLLDMLTDKVDSPKEEFCQVLLDGLKSPENLKKTGSAGKNEDEPTKTRLRKEARKKSIEKKINENKDEFYDKFRKFLNLRKTYKSQAGDHSVGWLEFSSSNREFTEYELAKVFELINMEGVDLTVIELLAARSVWRKTITGISNETFTPYRDISKQMGLHGKREPELVKDKCNRWHLACGFIPILLKDNPDRVTWLINFPELPPDPPSEDADEKTRKSIQKERTSKIQAVSEASFLLVSLLKKNSVEKNTWKNLAKDLDDSDWNALVSDAKTLKAAGQALYADEFFQNLVSFDKSIDSIFQATYATRFFVKQMVNEYIELNQPQQGDANCKKFQFIMRKWFDYVLYEAVTNQWVGGADQKLKENLDNPITHEQLEQEVAKEKWKDLIEEMCNDDKILTKDYVRAQTKIKKANVVMGDWKDKVKPILIYHQVLQGRNKDFVDIPENKEAEYKFHVDHIVSRNAWAKFLSPEKSKPLEFYEKNHCHNISNLCLLGFDANTSKGKNPIELYFNKADGYKTGKYHDYIKEQLEKFADLPNDPATLSGMNKPENFEKLMKHRRDKMVKVFKFDNRKKYLFDTGI